TRVAHLLSALRGAAPAPDEGAVAGRGAHLAALELVVIHAEAHRAAGLAPLEARGQEDLVQALGLGGLGDLPGAGHDERAHALGDLALLRYFCGGSKVGEPPIRARAHERHVDPGT